MDWSDTATVSDP